MNQFLKKSYYVFAALLVIICVLLLIWFWPTHRVPEKPVLTPLPAMVVESHETTEYFKAPGTIVPAVQSTLMAQVVANVTHINAYAGAAVKQGELLIQLDSRDYEAKVEQSKQQVKAREALLTNATLAFDRAKALIKKGFVSQAEYDTANANYLQAQANLAEAEKILRSAEVTLSYCEIRAPADGVVLEKFVDIGDQTVPLKPLLSFQAKSALRIDADVPSSLASKVHLGGKLHVSVNADQVDVMGVVSEIVPSVDPKSRSFVVKVTIPDNPGIYSGMFGQILIPVKMVNVIAIPQDYITQSGQLSLVYVQTDEGVNRVYITTGKSLDNGFIEVLSGLNPGDYIVAPGVAHAE